MHSLPTPTTAEAADARRRTRGRWQMLGLLLICAAPVLASYWSYYVVRPEGRTNYSTLIQPARAVPPSLALTRLDGTPASADALRGQWLIVAAAGGACDARCERQLVLQRQLHEAIGAEKDRVDKVWFVTDAAAPRAETLRAIGAAGPAGNVAAPLVLRVDAAALGRWLEPAAGHALDEHLYVVDPRGEWMMRAPADVDPAKLKRDLDKLLRASSSWDRPGR